jgi:hypothetical protein
VNIESILVNYAVCALWSSTGEDDTPLDQDHDIQDIAPETFGKMREDVKDFVKSNKLMLARSGLGEAQIGHDFWLTRNGHGAGFWDRGLGALGDQLTEACKAYSGVDLYVGDDGKIYS